MKKTECCEYNTKPPTAPPIRSGKSFKFLQTKKSQIILVIINV
jgi:hypothetical protein